MITKLFCAAVLMMGGISAFGQCTGTSPYICTGSGISIPATNQNGNLQSSAITVTGLPGSMSAVAVKINDWSDSNGDADREFMLVFKPSGGGATQAFQFAGGFGSYENLNSQTYTFADSATNYAPDGYDNPGVTGDTSPTNNAIYKPTVNLAYAYCSENSQDGSAVFVGATPDMAPCATTNPHSPGGFAAGGSATFASQFSGAPNGTWTLYVWTNKDDEDNSASIGSWSVNITTQSNAVNTTTTLASNAENNETTEGTPVTLTATVSSTSTVDEGTVAFKDGGNTIAGCGSQAVSSGTATCVTSFSAEGLHALTAAYSGGADFGTSNGSLNFFVDHATTNPSTGVYCNTGTITINTSTSPGTTPYPQHITIPTQGGTLSNITLTLPNINIGGIEFFNLLLVDPNGHKFVPLAGTGGFGNASNVTLTLSDYGSSMVPNPGSGAVPSGTYLPTDLNSGLSFASSPYGPPNGPYQLPQTQGAATFETTFAGSNPAGQWSLYAYYASGESTGTIGGYCLNLTTSAASATTTTLSSSPTGSAITGQQVTFTATVTSGRAVSGGTVTFEENGSVLSGPMAVNGSGQATFQTSSLGEGIHNITAQYSGVSGTYNVSSGSETIEIDSPTTNPSPGEYCNAGGVTISGSNSGQNIPASPYPSRINVTGLVGTVKTVSLNLNPFSDGEPNGSVFLLAGPTSTNIVPFNDVGGTNSVNSLDLTLADDGDSIPTPLASGRYSPMSGTGDPTPVFPAPAPSTLSFAAPQGTETLTSAFAGINPNGYWDLFLYDRFGSTAVNIGQWCLDITTNTPVLAVTKSHSGSFTQGDTSDPYTITVTNNGPVATAGVLTLMDTLPTGLTAVSFMQTGGGAGSDWSCSATSCTRTTAMAVNETDTLTLEVSVGYSAPTGTNSVTNSVQVSGGGAAAAAMANDPTTINVGSGYTLNLSVSPSGDGTAAANPTNSSGMFAGHYAPGANVSLMATANAGYAFSNWSGSADLTSSTANPTTIMMNSSTENVTANFVASYTNVTNSVSVTATGLIYNKVKKQGTETVTLTNVSGQMITGPIQLVLSGLPGGVTPVNNTGTFNGAPYWTAPAGGLAPGASAQVTVIFSYAAGTNFTTSAAVYSGAL